jgi:DNA (cytosine-5)-methyltransferase 1
MDYGSVCSGIEAATVAWEPLGWNPVWFSEIEPFPCNVLQYHYPRVPNLGDLTKLHDNPIFRTANVDLLVGGTPCQSFSQAGKRLGLDDPRGNLALEFLRLAKIKKPRWIVWENVPGILSSGGGQDFCAILQTLEECGYGVAYRELDSHYFGLPQRRRRIFVVGSLGDWRPASAVLFDAKAFGDYSARSRKETSIPVCTVRNAGNANARGVVVVERDSARGPQVARALTPAEEERRQGFSGRHTLIPNCTDAQRYKAIGNSMAIPVMRWIGERIKTVDNLTCTVNVQSPDYLLGL